MKIDNCRRANDYVMLKKKENIKAEQLKQETFPTLKREIQWERPRVQKTKSHYALNRNLTACVAKILQ